MGLPGLPGQLCSNLKLMLPLDTFLQGVAFVALAPESQRLRCGALEPWAIPGAGMNAASYCQCSGERGPPEQAGEHRASRCSPQQRHVGYIWQEAIFILLY